jgi:hypothetical protein
MLANAIDYSAGLPLIFYAGLALYLSSKALGDALVGGKPNRPGWLAVGQWLPIAVLAVGAALSHRPAMAMGLIFSTSVACLSLGIGSVAFMGIGAIPAGARKCWALLLPASLLAFFAGFRSAVSPVNAGILALEGACLLLLWNDRPDPVAESRITTQAGRGFWIRALQTSLGLLLAGVGSWFAIHGIDRVGEGSEFASTGLLTATLISPLLVLPIIGTGTEMAQRNQSVSAVQSQVGVVLLNICGLVPMVVVAGAICQLVSIRYLPLGQHWTIPIPRFTPAPVTPAPFPLGVWRVDVPACIALSLFLLPVALGKWTLTRLQGLALMGGYVLYLLLTVLWQQFVLYGVLKVNP